MVTVQSNNDFSLRRASVNTSSTSAAPEIPRLEGGDWEFVDEKVEDYLVAVARRRAATGDTVAWADLKSELGLA